MSNMTSRALDDIPAGLGVAKRNEFIYEKKVTPSEDGLSMEAHDGIHDGLIFPTEEERETLRRVPDNVPWNAYRE